MDYRALAELVWFTFLGLSALFVAGAVSLRFVLKPFFRDFLAAYRERNAGRIPPEAEHRISLLESRILDLEGELDSVREGQRFDRLLEGGAEQDGRTQEEDTPAE